MAGVELNARYARIQINLVEGGTSERVLGRCILYAHSVSSWHCIRHDYITYNRYAYCTCCRLISAEYYVNVNWNFNDEKIN